MGVVFYVFFLIEFDVCKSYLVKFFDVVCFVGVYDVIVGLILLEYYLYYFDVFFCIVLIVFCIEVIEYE